MSHCKLWVSMNIKTTLIISLFGTFLVSCNNSENNTISEQNENESDSIATYKELYSDYIQAVKDSTPFRDIVQTFFYEPEELLADTGYFGCYDLNAIGNAYLSHTIHVSKSTLNLLWQEDAKKSSMMDAFDPFCDCNLVIESEEKESDYNLPEFSMSICFKDEKIYSTNQLRNAGSRCQEVEVHNNSTTSDTVKRLITQ